MHKLIACLLAVLNCLSGNATKIDACGQNETQTELSLESVEIRVCLKEDWSIEDKILSYKGNKEIQISSMRSQDFTYPQLIPKQNRSNKNFHTWNEIGMYYEEEVVPLGTNRVEIIEHYLYPLRYSTVEITFERENGHQKEVHRIIDSMHFTEKQPFKALEKRR